MNDNVTKASAVADAINTLLRNLVAKCTKSDGIRDYYYVGVIGYGGMGVASAFQGPLSNKHLVPIGVIGNTPARVEKRSKRIADGKGGFVERPYNFPVWFEEQAGGGTPMCAAFQLAVMVLKSWLVDHPHCFPPIVINITDGESTDGNPEEAANQLMSLASSDGQILLFNLLLSSFSQQVIAYPESPSELEDEFAKQLFRISSPLTSYLRRVLANEGYTVGEDSRGLVVHADLSLLIRFLDIGTRPANLPV
ncbi:MAG TPA: hypothetical protein V6D17_20515 [Candidatus Obscuribacterales bacterium]